MGFHHSLNLFSLNFCLFILISAYSSFGFVVRFLDFFPDVINRCIRMFNVLLLEKNSFFSEK